MKPPTTKTIAANLKAFHTPKSILRYFENLDSKIATAKGIDVLVFPNQASLVDNAYSHFNLGAQNAYPVDSGAFSGEIGYEVLEALRVRHIMLGHSERRRIFDESDELVARKFEFFASKNMKIMLCVGEDFVRDSNNDSGEDSCVDSQNLAKIHDFLAKQLDLIDVSYPLLSIAYEPLWAIGSGRTPSPSDIDGVVRILRGLGCQKILYGGSVGEQNILDICRVCDGVLVGGASVDSNNFAKMINMVAGSMT